MEAPDSPIRTTDNREKIMRVAETAVQPQANVTRPAVPHRVLRKSWMKQFPIVSEEDIRAKAAFSDDLNPIHHDDEAARGEGLEGIVASATQLFGYICSTVAEGFPLVKARKVLELNFENPLYAGGYPSVHCETERCMRGVARVKTTIKNGTEIIATGWCLIVLSKT